MTEVLEQVLNFIKVTNYDFNVTTHYTSDTDWHIEIRSRFTSSFFVTIFPDKWVRYGTENKYSGVALESHTYESTIYSMNFSDALHMVYHCMY